MALQPKAGNAPRLRRMLMRLFPTPSKNVLRRIIVTTSLLCYTNHFHRMRFAGFADGEPQSTGTTDSGSDFCAIGFKFSAVEFKFWVNEYNHYTACTSF
jgi:hypothetical protein